MLLTRSLLSSLSFFSLATSAAAAGWEFIEVGQSGVIALEVIIVSPTLAIFFDRATNDPLMVDGHAAWGALWNLETNKASALNLVTDTFCASGAILSNGTMVNRHYFFLLIMTYS